MPKRSRLTLAAAIALIALMLPTGVRARERRTRASRNPGTDPALLRSPELWATIDVCNTPKKTHWIGVSASMPGDGHASDKMYMRFVLQRLSAVNQWVEVAHSGYVLVGSAKKHAEYAWEFKPEPEAKGVWRALVGFKWMRAKTVVQTASRLTTPGHDAVPGAEPAGYSAATCTIPLSTSSRRRQAAHAAELRTSADRW